jgi:3-hexulose-6-phosphate synthase
MAGRGRGEFMGLSGQGGRGRLQLAIDTLLPEEADALVARVRDLVDVVEVGTPMLLRDGVGAVRRLRDAFSGLVLLADMKIMDGGRLEASMGFQAGARLVTVLAAAEDATIRAVVRAAEEAGGEVMVDLIGVKDPEQRAAEVDALGVHHVCVHTPVDVQQEEGRDAADGLASLRRIRDRLRRAHLSVAGGIGPGNVARIAPLAPDLVVVGSAISSAADPRAAAAAVRAVLDAAWRAP